MVQQLVDSQGNTVGAKKEVIADLNKIDGIELSPFGMAMLDTLMTSEMLRSYALQHIALEAPDSLEEAQKTVGDMLEAQGQFNLENIKYRIFNVLQIIMTHFAKLGLEAAASVTSKEESKDRNPEDNEQPGEDTPEDGTDPESV